MFIQWMSRVHNLWRENNVYHGENEISFSRIDVCSLSRRLCYLREDSIDSSIVVFPHSIDWFSGALNVLHIVYVETVVIYWQCVHDMLVGFDVDSLYWTSWLGSSCRHSTKNFEYLLYPSMSYHNRYRLSQMMMNVSASLSLLRRIRWTVLMLEFTFQSCKRYAHMNTNRRTVVYKNE
jgi:hypothetical protein